MPRAPAKKAIMESNPNLRNSEKRKVGENNSLLSEDSGGTTGQGRNKRMKTQDPGAHSFLEPRAVTDNGQSTNHEDTLLRDDESGTLNPITQSMEDRLLSTTVDSSQRRSSGDSESGGSTNSDKFYCEIKLKAEKTGTPKSELPEQKPDVSKWVDNNNGPSSLAEHEESEERSVNVFLRIVDPSTGKTIFDSKRSPIKTTLSTMEEFLKAHNKEIDHSIFNKPANSSKFSLGSTISRPSMASTLNRPSSIMGEISETSDTTLVNPVKIAQRRKRGEFGPILSSTRLGEDNELEADLEPTRESVSSSRNSKSNGTAASSSYTSTSNATPSFSSNTRSRRSDSADHERKVTKAKGFATETAAEEFNDPEFTKSITLWGTIAPNQPVFARWRDRKYYSGIVTKKGSNDTWCINFDDDMKDVASESHILPVKVLGVKNYAVYCPQDKFKEELVIIVGQRSLKAQDESGVADRTEYACISDEDGRIIFCRRQNLSLQEVDARELRKNFQAPTAVTKAADLNVGNIVVEPRRRTGAKSPPPSSVIRKLVAGAFDASSTDPQVFDPSTPVVIKPAGSRTSRRPSSPPRDSSGDTDEGTGNTVAVIPASKSNDSSKPLVKTEKKIFHGFQFFLTASGMPAPEGHFYDKEECRFMIEDNGGTVVESVGKEDPTGKDIYLISDNYARTVKYIYALAAGFPCVGYKWIEFCCSEGRLLDFNPYRLASGMSIAHNCVIPHHSEKPLKGLKIFVTSDSAELYNYWKPVLTVAEAVLLRKQKSRVRKVPLIPDGTEVVITDSGCPQEVQDAAKAKGLTLVKPEWLVQAIITGQKVPYEGDEKYIVIQKEIDVETERERLRELDREQMRDED